VELNLGEARVYKAHPEYRGSPDALHKWMEEHVDVTKSHAPHAHALDGGAGAGALPAEPAGAHAAPPPIAASATAPLPDGAGLAEAVAGHADHAATGHADAASPLSPPPPPVDMI
jgi:hypothetical protein